MGHLKFVCLVFVEDTLADFEGVLRTIRPRSGSNWATDRIRWVRRSRNRLRTLMRGYAAEATNPTGDRVIPDDVPPRAQEAWTVRSDARRAA